jgi:hypothetical protein
MFKNTFLFIDKSVFVENWLQRHYKLWYLFSGALFIEWKFKNVLFHYEHWRLQHKIEISLWRQHIWKNDIHTNKTLRYSACSYTAFWQSACQHSLEQFKTEASSRAGMSKIIKWSQKMTQSSMERHEISVFTR